MTKLSLVIPVYNEAPHLEDFLQRIDAMCFVCEKELIIVDDASTDNSAAIIQSFKFQSLHKFFRHHKNQGKGAALATGIGGATGQIIGIQDADFEYEILDIPALIEPIITGKADVVYGSRFKKNGAQVHRTFHYLINRILTILSNFFSGLYLTDMETCYKFFHADIIQNIPLYSKRFGFEPEITAKIARLKVRVEEHPISYFPRTYIEGKKITWRDGVAAVRHILFFNLVQKSVFSPQLPKKYIPRDGQWF